MHVSRKCQYTLRALFELAKRHGEGPVSVAQIAEAQAIPARFLEVILQGLKKTGAIQSQRGIHGGYVLAVSPDAISVGDVIRSVDGSAAPVRCVVGRGEQHCRLRGQCAFMGVWERARQAIEQVYDATTLQDLIDEERLAAERREPLMYCV
jgi:Rrf2 family protein